MLARSFPLYVMASLVILVCLASYLHPVSADSPPNEIKTATSGSHVYVVWQQRSDGQLEKQDIYFRASSDIVDQSSTIMTGDGKVNVYWKNFAGSHDTLLYLGDINGTRVTNLLDQTPKHYQSIWTNEETIIKKPVYKKPEALVIVNGTNNDSFSVNTTVSYGPKNAKTNLPPSDEIKNNTSTTNPIYGGGGPIVTISLGPPLKQFRSGVSANDVICKQGLQLIIKSEGDTPGCTKPITAFQLVKRGWGSLASLTMQTMSIDNTQFSANYAITNAKILGIKSDPQSLSIVADLQANNDGI